MKRGTTTTRKTRKTKSDNEEKTKPKKCVKNVKQPKKPVQSADMPVAGSSRQSDSGDSLSKRKQNPRKKKTPGRIDNSGSKGKPQKKKNVNNEEQCNNERESDSNNSKQYATPLSDLDFVRRVDPEFYSFLEEHDTGLYSFGDHEHVLVETENEEEEDEEDDVIIEGPLEDDSDCETEAPQPGAVTLETVQEFQFALQKNNVKLGTIKSATKVFHGAVLMATSRQGIIIGEYIVTEADVFRAVLDVCVENLPDAIETYLGIETYEEDPQTSMKFGKIKSSLREYLSDLLNLLLELTSDSVLTAMLKHLHQLSIYVACFSRMAKRAIRNLLPLWCRGTGSVRIYSFMCIMRITRNQQETLLIPVVKAMFWTYLKNCKFVSPATWPNINFMRRSLVEMYMLEVNDSYSFVPFYVKQLAIHLRNAIVLPSEEHNLAVFNWQYMNALHLWAELVSKPAFETEQESLHFPVVMIVSNLIKLEPTPQYYPLRFHLIEMLMKMQEASGEFITIIPFFIDVLKTFDINQKTEVSRRPLDFSCMIRLSECQMKESGFVDAVVQRLCALLLQYTASLSYKMIFPECCTGLMLYLRDMVDTCENIKHKNKLKKVFTKITETSQFISKKRATFNGDMVELAPILAWEEKMKSEGTPLSIYYEKWKKQRRT